MCRPVVTPVCSVHPMVGSLQFTRKVFVCKPLCPGEWVTGSRVYIPRLTPEGDEIQSSWSAVLAVLVTLRRLEKPEVNFLIPLFCPVEKRPRDSRPMCQQSLRTLPSECICIQSLPTTCNAPLV